MDYNAILGRPAAEPLSAGAPGGGPQWYKAGYRAGARSRWKRPFDFPIHTPATSREAPYTPETHPMWNSDPVRSSTSSGKASVPKAFPKLTVPARPNRD
jgi:hypothetical protein